MSSPMAAAAYRHNLTMMVTSLECIVLSSRNISNAIRQTIAHGVILGTGACTAGVRQIGAAP